jgi:hypothetical protein
VGEVAAQLRDLAVAPEPQDQAVAAELGAGWASVLTR